MAYEPRSAVFLEREGRIKHYEVGRGGPADPALVAATRAVAAETVPADAYGFTIAHDAASAGLGLVYWWENENEIHSRLFGSPDDDRGALSAYEGTAMACVWELEVIDFERRAWLEDVLKAGDHDSYLQRAMEPTKL